MKQFWDDAYGNLTGFIEAFANICCEDIEVVEFLLAKVKEKKSLTPYGIISELLDDHPSNKMRIEQLNPAYFSKY